MTSFARSVGRQSNLPTESANDNITSEISRDLRQFSSAEHIQILIERFCSVGFSVTSYVFKTLLLATQVSIQVFSANEWKRKRISSACKTSLLFCALVKGITFEKVMFILFKCSTCTLYALYIGLHMYLFVVTLYFHNCFITTQWDCAGLRFDVFKAWLFSTYVGLLYRSTLVQYCLSLSVHLRNYCTLDREPFFQNVMLR
jgi:hypothetical protein